MPGETPAPEFPLDVKPSSTFDEALRGMADRPFLATQKFQQQQWRANREGAHPSILVFESVFIRRMAKLGVPMFAHCVVRTEHEQWEQFVDGDSRDDPKDGLWPHRGTAVDLIHSVKAWNLDKRQWALVGHIGKEIAAQRGFKLTWGGDWSFYDPAHWEVTGWKAIAGEYPWPISTR